MGEEQIKKTKEKRSGNGYTTRKSEPEKHISKIFRSAYKMLTNIRVPFQCLDKDMMKKIITCKISPKLEYATVV
ncbi:hypothetical protein E2C01_022647 [Portunus trituberculatus]|uniref:Uncharacterized protein n=1 Tax=Portunus trituberculatus TaxID=210409 RepID=A0A5B7E7V2_PORTR|nr:hypothetical protein [Portunus trituberculatus]